MTKQQTLKNPRLDVGDYFDIGWSIFKDNLSNFLVLVLVIDIPIAILQILSPTPDNSGEFGIGASPTSLLVVSATIVLSIVGFVSALILTESAVLNRPIEIFEVIQQGFSRFLPSFLLTLVGGIIIILGVCAISHPRILFNDSLLF